MIFENQYDLECGQSKVWISTKYIFSRRYIIFSQLQEHDPDPRFHSFHIRLTSIKLPIPITRKIKFYILIAETD